MVGDWVNGLDSLVWTDHCVILWSVGCCDVVAIHRVVTLGASNLINSDGLRPNSDGLQPNSNGLRPNSDGLHANSDGLHFSAFPQEFGTAAYGGGDQANY